MKKYLLVKGCAGLGNRLFSVTRAIEIALATNRTLIVDWRDGQFGPAGTDAFAYFFSLAGIDHDSLPEETSNLTVFPKAWTNNLHAPVYERFKVQKPPGHTAPFLYKIFPFQKIKMLGGYWIKKEIKAFSNWVEFISGAFSQNAFAFGDQLSNKSSKDVLVFVDFSPNYDSKVFLRHIKLKDIYLERVNSFCENHGLFENGIGVHIRATDKKPEKEITVIIKHLQQFRNSGMKIFLATDNLAIQKKFLVEFKDKLVVYPKFLHDDQRVGLHQHSLYNNEDTRLLVVCEESIMDMWILSMCKFLYYQGNSSFSIISRILHPCHSNCYDWQLL